jgi:transposase-like protein
MNISTHHSTPNRGLSATSQAPQELGDSQKFLEKCDASRLSQTSPENCPRCGSANVSKGAGLKPGQISLKCSDCKAFIGYRKLQKLKRQKDLTACLEFLESCGISGDVVTVFVLGQVGGEV